MAISARSKAFLPGIIFMALILIVVMRFGALILALILLPMIIAFFFDHQKDKPLFKIIAACNLSSSLQFIIPIVQLSLERKFAEAGLVMDNPMSWAFVYCGSAAGWGILYLAKFGSRVVTLMHYDYSISFLQKKQEKLVQEFGESISQSIGNKRS